MLRGVPVVSKVHLPGSRGDNAEHEQGLSLLARMKLEGKLSC